MTTVKNQTIGGRPCLRRSLALLCAAVLLLGLWMPWAKAAVGDTITITVKDTAGAAVTGLDFYGYADIDYPLTDNKDGSYSGTITSDSTEISLSLGAAQHIIVSGTVDGTDITINRRDNSAPFTPNDTNSTAVALVVTPVIQLTAAPDTDIVCSQFDQMLSGLPFNAAAGVNLKFQLMAPRGQAFAGFSAKNVSVVTGCTIGSTSFMPTDLVYASPDAITGTISGEKLTADGALSIALDPKKLVDNIGVIPVPGTGFALDILEIKVPPPADTLHAMLTVEAEYSSSVPELTTPAVPDCIIQKIRSQTDPDTGTVRHEYSFTRVDAAPFTENLAVSVSGIVRNAPPPSYGGDDEEEEPAIRVENELNKGDVKSDTTLWPSHTTESGGVSTTTVTDDELKALLELARQHAKDIEGIPGEGLKEGIFYIEDLHAGSENSSYVLKLTGDQLHTLAQENWDRLTVQTPAGSFSLYPEALAQTDAEITYENQPVRITLHRLNHENRPGVDASLTVDKNQVISFETPYGVRIVVPYTPAPGEDLNALVIDYIHEDGTVERVTECYYDPEAGGLVFFTTHLSKFGVAYRPAAFTDVTAKHWANPYVTFLASRGVISGYGDKKFRPDDLATRGETIAMLTKALSAVKCPKKPIQVYTDVGLGSSIAGASNWLYFNNLAPFLTTGTQLKPGAPVAKQDVAALVNNVAAGMGLRLRSRGLDTGYTDMGELADYAKPAVVRLTSAGVLPMTSNFKFNPKTNINRGELAQITAALLSNL